jgi:molybdopterin synthase catalytic subunit
LTDWLLLTSEALAVGRALEFLADPSAGGIDVFLGTTRAQIGASGQKLIALDYEAYDAMVAGQFAKMAAEARQKWPVVKLVILHREGRVALGEPSVLIGVSTPHRAEAFAACRWLIDALKSEVAIWKKEIWEGGEGTWVNPKSPN